MSKNTFLGFGKNNKTQNQNYNKVETDEVKGNFSMSLDTEAEDTAEEDEKAFDIDALENIVKPQNSTLPPVYAAPAVAIPTQEVNRFPVKNVDQSQDDAVISKGMNVTGNMNIEHGKLYVYGVINGEVNIDGVIVMEGGQIVGNVKCKGLQMSKKSCVKGNVTVEDDKNGNVKINDSRVEGNIVGAHNLEMDEDSEIGGIVEASNNAIINGKLNGDHVKGNRVSFGENSQITANVQAKSMSVATGASIHGSVSIVKEGAKK